MAEQPKARPDAAPTDSNQKPSSPSRRRWLQAGLSAPPVLMTVVSRPVLAAQCVPPSAYVSAGASAPGMYADCTGNGPVTWPGLSWPVDQASSFNEIFVSPALIDSPTLFQVLTLPSEISPSAYKYNDVARYVVAAWLNYKALLVPDNVLGEPIIKHIWTESGGGTGSFSPGAGDPWYSDEIVKYLKSTMTSD